MANQINIYAMEPGLCGQNQDFKTDIQASVMQKDGIDPLDFVDKSRFEKDCEREMFDVLDKLKSLAINCDRDKYKLLADGLVSSAQTLANFFDGEGSVMVMTDDINLRNNRLNLLTILRNQSLKLADFSKLS